MTGRNLLLGITIVIFCLFLLIVLTTKRNQPLYQGKTVHYWIRDYAFNSGGIGSQSRYESAIQALGTNAIPALLDCLRAKDSALTTPLFNLAIKHHWPALRPVRAIELHLAGFMGFYALGANGSPAVPTLMKIYEEKDSPETQMNVALSLSYIGPDARAAVPLLLREAQDTNRNVRETALGALRGIHEDPEEVVPLFIRCLSDSDPNIQLLGVSGLWGFGTNAKPALPALIPLATNPVPAATFSSTRLPTAPPTSAEIQQQARRTLKQIDPGLADRLMSETGETWPDY